MPGRHKPHKRFFMAMALLTAAPLVHLGASDVTILRAPHDGIQPQGAVDSDGNLHLIYFKGHPEGGNLFYVRKSSSEGGFSEPIRVNQYPESIQAAGIVRGAQMAIGRENRIHVAWVGSAYARPKGPSGSLPMLYTRMKRDGTGFEPERNVKKMPLALDGGGAIAADPFGNVHIAWHAGPRGHGEAGRKVWVAHSRDDGGSFTREVPAVQQTTGACACCSLQARADAQGNVYILYRRAQDNVERGMFLLRSYDHGNHFSGTVIDRWRLFACPASTAKLSESAAGVLFAWEKSGQIFFSMIDKETEKLTNAVAAPGHTQKKHPVIAANSDGRILLAWTENAPRDHAHRRSVVWQIYGDKGKRLGPGGKRHGLSRWGSLAAFAQQNDRFLLVY